MAISSDNTYSLNANQIVEKAFSILGVGLEGEALTARNYADGMTSLNLLVKTWGARPHLWVKATQSVALVEGQASYVLSPRAMRVLGVRRRTNSIDVPMNELSRQGYDDTPNKSVKSTPVSFYFDPQVASGTLYVWPTPSASVAAATTLQVTYHRRMADFDAANDDADLPQEWLQALVWNLANELEPEYPVNDARLAGKIERKAAMLLDDLSGWDNEPASVYLQADAWNY